MANEKNELLKFIGINTELIGDLLKAFIPEDPDLGILIELLKLYQENEEYRNKYEALCARENISLANELIAMKTKRGAN